MKAYIITSGAIFGLITLAHIARIFAEGLSLAANPLFIALTVVAGALCFWSWRVLRRLSQS
jgi:hypothetical protein